MITRRFCLLASVAATACMAFPLTVRAALRPHSLKWVRDLLLPTLWIVHGDLAKEQKTDVVEADIIIDHGTFDGIWLLCTSQDKTVKKAMLLTRLEIEDRTYLTTVVAKMRAILERPPA